MAEPRSVVFDMDGVIVDSESVWTAVRKEIVNDWGGSWPPEADTAMMGMNPLAWSTYMKERLGLSGFSPTQIRSEVVHRLSRQYQLNLPLIPGAVGAVQLLAQRYELGLASSSDLVIIEAVLGAAGIRDLFSIYVSSEEVAHGKPSPDVYLEACRRLSVAPSDCVAIEDSGSGICAASSAGLAVVAIPHRDYLPKAEVLSLAGVVLDSIERLDVAAVLEAFGDKRGSSALT